MRSTKYLKFSKVTWGLIVCFLVILFILWNLGKEFHVEVSHVGYTNDPASGITYAIFVVTNSGAGTITRWPELRIEYKAQAALQDDGYFSDVVGIIPTGHEKIYVPGPKNPGSWRVTVFCSPDCFRASVGELFGTISSPRSRAVMRDWLHVVPVRRVRSDWIEPIRPPNKPD